MKTKFLKYIMKTKVEKENFYETKKQLKLVMLMLIM